jgi:ABC-type cobalamin transport system ATPase subunit
MAHIAHAQLHEIAAAKLAIDDQSNSARSQVRTCIWTRTRMAQMSLTFKGAFWPTSFQLFHGDRPTTVTVESISSSSSG